MYGFIDKRFTCRNTLIILAALLIFCSCAHALPPTLNPYSTCTAGTNGTSTCGPTPTPIVDGTADPTPDPVTTKTVETPAPTAHPGASPTRTVDVTATPLPSLVPKGTPEVAVDTDIFTPKKHQPTKFAFWVLLPETLRLAEPLRAAINDVRADELYLAISRKFDRFWVDVNNIPAWAEEFAKPTWILLPGLNNMSGKGSRADKEWLKHDGWDALIKTAEKISKWTKMDPSSYTGKIQGIVIDDASSRAGIRGVARNFLERRDAQYLLW